MPPRTSVPASILRTATEKKPPPAIVSSYDGLVAHPEGQPLLEESCSKHRIFRPHPRSGDRKKLPELSVFRNPRHTDVSYRLDRVETLWRHRPQEAGPDAGPAGGSSVSAELVAGPSGVRPESVDVLVTSLSSSTSWRQESLWDAVTQRLSREVPASRIPPEFFIYQSVPLLDPSKNEDPVDVVVDGELNRFRRRIFPTSRPAGRSEVLYLARVADLLHERLLSHRTDPRSFSAVIEDELRIWDIVLHELVRQVFVHCVERGVLLDKVRLGLRQLIDGIVTRIDGVIALDDLLVCKQKELREAEHERQHEFEQVNHRIAQLETDLEQCLEELANKETELCRLQQQNAELLGEGGGMTGADRRTDDDPENGASHRLLGTSRSFRSSSRSFRSSSRSQMDTARRKSIAIQFDGLPENRGDESWLDGSDSNSAVSARDAESGESMQSPGYFADTGALSALAGGEPLLENTQQHRVSFDGQQSDEAPQSGRRNVGTTTDVTFETFDSIFGERTTSAMSARSSASASEAVSMSPPSRPDGVEKKRGWSMIALPVESRSDYAEVGASLRERGLSDAVSVSVQWEDDSAGASTDVSGSGPHRRASSDVAKAVMLASDADSAGAEHGRQWPDRRVSFGGADADVDPSTAAAHKLEVRSGQGAPGGGPQKSGLETQGRGLSRLETAVVADRYRQRPNQIATLLAAIPDNYRAKDRGIKWTLKNVSEFYNFRCNMIVNPGDLTSVEASVAEHSKILGALQEFHLFKYGLRTLSEMYFVDFLFSCRRYADRDRRCRNMLRFLGLSEWAGIGVPDIPSHLFALFLCGLTYFRSFSVGKMQEGFFSVHVAPAFEGLLGFLSPLVSETVALEAVGKLLAHVGPNKLADSEELMSEVISVVAAAGTMSIESLLHKHFEIYDMDGDGFLSMNEFLQFLSRSVAHPPRSLQMPSVASSIAGAPPPVAAPDTNPSRVSLYREALDYSSSNDMVDARAIRMLLLRHRLNLTKDIPALLVPAQVPSRAAPGSSGALPEGSGLAPMELLVSAWETTKPFVESRLAFLRSSKIYANAMAVEQLERAQHVLEETMAANVSDAAWDAYRSLLHSLSKAFHEFERSVEKSADISSADIMRKTEHGRPFGTSSASPPPDAHPAAEPTASRFAATLSAAADDPRARTGGGSPTSRQVARVSLAAGGARQGRSPEEQPADRNTLARPVVRPSSKAVVPTTVGSGATREIEAVDEHSMLQLPSTNSPDHMILSTIMLMRPTRSGAPQRPLPPPEQPSVVRSSHRGDPLLVPSFGHPPTGGLPQGGKGSARLEPASRARTASTLRQDFLSLGPTARTTALSSLAKGLTLASPDRPENSGGALEEAITFGRSEPSKQP